MPQTVVEKIAQSHMAEGPRGRPVRTGDFLTIRPRHVLTHDNTSPVMAKFRAIGAARIADPKQPMFALDHDIQNESEANLTKYGNIESFAAEQGVDFHPAGTGIGHQVMVERLYARPGAFVVGSDSHSNMYGGIGALGTPIVRTDAAAVWAAETFWWQIPRTIEVVLTGELPAGSSGKDLILLLCGLYNEGQVLNAALEFSGPGVATLSMEDRLAVANMTTEWGALTGWFPPDETTLEYIEKRRAILWTMGIDTVTDEQMEEWRENPLRPDPDAVYAGRIRLDLGTVTPQVTGPDSVQVTTPLSEMEKREIPIHKAYLVSCVNSRVGDIAEAAAVLRGKKVADGVEFYAAPASAEVLAEAESRGDWQTLLDAGATPLPPGCGPCIGLGTGLLEAGQVGISATNRNFKGRMGSRDAECYLASPAVVAASAAAGRICGPVPAEESEPVAEFESFDAAATPDEAVDILDGFPERIEGRLVFLPPDNLNTDGIYGKDYTYRDDMTVEKMAEVVFENYEPGLAGRLAANDVIVSGYNFGTGSSREQAATAILAKGIPLVIAGSFSQTYLRNAFNNGFPCIACPPLVDHLKARFEAEVAGGAKSVIPGDAIVVEFATGNVTVGGETFRFPPLGEVPQALVVAGGVENQVRTKLGL